MEKKMLEELRNNKELDFQAHKLFFTKTKLLPLKGGGTKIVHNFKVSCPFQWNRYRRTFDIPVELCGAVYKKSGEIEHNKMGECEYLDGISHDGIYCLAEKLLKLKEKEAYQMLEVPKKLKGCPYIRREDSQKAKGSGK
jgi:hypothetical protein